ncbi:hypothetical protein CK214_15565 [Mesorhizobium sp. WSM3882]|nr:hypothetical protein CK214_15565 [Mesorhizobium sp. WSM3882]TIR01172.1 MAG: hypothetical protein E5X36_02485 [Mesorhizobium sp.]
MWRAARKRSGTASRDFSVGARHPPLSCRTSPPQGGRLDVTSAFANLQRGEFSETHELPIFSLEGEMAGRPEGGAWRCLSDSICLPNSLR